ncbi:hypothetical protein ACFQ1S_24365 [Kibdelosporangium lantanae]|uniref:Uncharacterized protein n=1 Tax=Kibdelosporangium lantanae TaxID=1497396 RepID=A0ABW3MCT5_9PSEU
MSTAGVPSRPRTLGIGLACCAAAIIVNVLIQLLSLVLSRAESSLWTSLLLGVVLAAALLLLTYRGYGLAYVALGGVIAYALIVRVIDVVVTTPTLTQSDISPEGMVVVWALTLLGYAQLVLLVLGAALAFGPGELTQGLGAVHVHPDAEGPRDPPEEPAHHVLAGLPAVERHADGEERAGQQRRDGRDEPPDAPDVPDCRHRSGHAAGATR